MFFSANVPVMLVDTLMTFNRLKQLSTDKQVVIDTIKESDKLTVEYCGICLRSSMMTLPK